MHDKEVFSTGMRKALQAEEVVGKIDARRTQGLDQRERWTEEKSCMPRSRHSLNTKW